MTTSINGTSVTFDSARTLATHPGTIRAATATYSSTQITSAASTSNYLNLEIVMPPATSANSKYLLISECKCDDTNSGTAGVGLSWWVSTSGGGGPTSSYWVHRQGAHNQYNSQNTDKYFTQQNIHLDDGATSTPILAGQTRTYRLYGDANNVNIWFATTNVSGTVGFNAGIFVMELDGSVFV